MSKAREKKTIRLQVLAAASALVTLLSVSACNFKYDKAEANAEPDDRLNQTDVVGYAEINEAILKPKCLGCHGTRRPVLTTYEAVIENLKEIEDTTLVRRTMPRRGPLSEDLQKMLKGWIDAGAPKIGTGPVPSPTPVEGGIPRPFNYANLKKSVLEGKCITCHSTGNEDGITALDTYADLMSVESLIQPFIFGIAGGETIPADERMPPPRAAPLTDEEKALVLIWFADGMRDANGIPAPKPTPTPTASPAPTPTPSSEPAPVPSPSPNGVAL